MKTNSAFSLILILILSTTGLHLEAARKNKDSCDKIDFYKDQISTLNLLNGLNLSTEQMEKLLELNREIENIKKEILESPEYVKINRDAEKALGDLHEYLMSHPEQENEEIQNKAAEANNRIKEFFKDNNENFEKIRNDIAVKVNNILTCEQLEVINSFKPCIIPPKDFRDPVRAGQAASSSRPEKILSKIRGIQDKKRLDMAAEKIADRIIYVTNEKIYKMTDAEEREKRAEIIETIKKAHSMSDTEFELKEKELVEKLHPEDKLGEMFKEIQERNPHVSSLGKTKHDDAVRRFLLRPEIVIPILEKRLAVDTVGGLR